MLFQLPIWAHFKTQPSFRNLTKILYFDLILKRNRGAKWHSYCSLLWPSRKGLKNLLLKGMYPLKGRKFKLKSDNVRRIGAGLGTPWIPFAIRYFFIPLMKVKTMTGIKILMALSLRVEESRQVMHRTGDYHAACSQDEVILLGIV
jgi:hypothetical protein